MASGDYMPFDPGMDPHTQQLMQTVQSNDVYQQFFNSPQYKALMAANPGGTSGDVAFGGPSPAQVQAAFQAWQKQGAAGGTAVDQARAIQAGAVAADPSQAATFQPSQTMRQQGNLIVSDTQNPVTGTSATAADIQAQKNWMDPTLSGGEHIAFGKPDSSTFVGNKAAPQLKSVPNVMSRIGGTYTDDSTINMMRDFGLLVAGGATAGPLAETLGGGALGGAGAGATLGGGGAAITGGDPVRGALVGGTGGAIAGSLPEGTTPTAIGGETTQVAAGPSTTTTDVTAGTTGTMDPSGLGAGDVAFDTGKLGLSSAASGGAVADPTGLFSSDLTVNPAGQVGVSGGAASTTPVSAPAQVASEPLSPTPGSSTIDTSATSVGGDTATSPTTPAFINSITTPSNLDPTTASALGITFAPTIGDLPVDPALSGGFQTTTGGIPGGAPEMGGATGTGAFDQRASEGVFDSYGNPLYESPTTPTSFLDDTTALLKKLGLTPAQAALLGIAGYGMGSKPKLPQAGQTLSDNATAGSADARAQISSGGTSGPAWGQQKKAIDAAIDQQITEQTEAMLQQAVNNGTGADSQVTRQQIDKLKTNLETKRQELYMAAQSQNVQAALQELGISDRALAQVTQAQFSSDAQARQLATMTAELAMLLGTRG